ncbi:MAG: DUF111 family protein, partial [Kiritimatiellae bacterium]|nr:DUF111 family protein [Kiritimatiellia bacterium]
ILRAFRGEAHPAASPRPVTPPRPVCEVLQTPHPQQVCQFRCAIDDMTAEDLAFAASQILEAGALDVLMLPALMKKGRPGTVLEVLCRPEARDAIAECIFRNTTTIGLREEIVARRALERRAETVETPLGAVRVKISEGYGVTRAKPEFEDLARIAGGKS